MNYLKKELYELIKTDDSIFEFIQNQSFDGFWFWDIENDENEWISPSFWETLGYNPNEMDHKTVAWQNIINPDDLLIANQNFTKHCQNPNHPYNQVIRYTHKNGSTVWMQSKGVVIRNSAGKPIRMLGINNDITELKQKEQLLVESARTARLGSWEVNFTANTFFWSPTTKVIFEVDPDYEPNLATVTSFFKEGKSREAIAGLLTGTVQNSNPYNFQLEIITQKGNTRWIETWGTPEFVAGKCVRIKGLFQDISQRKKIELQNQELTQRLSIATQSAGIGIWEYDLVNNRLLWDDQMYALYGVSRETFRNVFEEWRSTLHPDDAEQTVKLMRMTIDGKAEFAPQFRIILPNGAIRHIQAKGMVLKDENGVVTGMIGTNWDITQQKEADAELESQNHRNKIFVEQAPNAIAMFDTQMCYMAASQKWLADYNLLGQQIIGKSHYEIFPEIGDDWKKIHQECLEGTINKCEEAFFERADGTQQWITWDVRPWYVSEDVIGGLLMYTADITERKNVARLLHISEESFTGAFENSAIGMALIGKNGEWLKVNNSVCDITGYTRAELSNLTFQDITHPDDLHTDLDLLQELVDGKRNAYKLEKRYYHKNGHIVWIILAVSVVKNNDGSILHFISQITDITKTKLAEQKQQEALLQLQGILDGSTHVSIISTDTQGLITSFNKGAENLLGYTAEEMVLKHSPIIIHKEEEAIQRGKELSELFGREISGLNVFVEYARLGQHESREWTFVRKNGTTFPVQLVITATKNPQGTITGFLGIAIDISQLKEVEKEIKSLLSVTNDQNNRLLNFAHIVSHNLRSHSSNLSMLMDLMLVETDEDVKQEIFPLLQEAANNLKDTIGHLNEVAVMNTTITENLKPINLYKAVNASIGNIQGLIKTKGGTCNNYIDENITVMVVPAYLDSILLNFLTNGIKYHQNNVAPIINITAKTIGKHICITIQDNGRGIDLKRYGAKLFGMYKTFHGNDDARGIGLFITKNQVEAMGGRIEVESELNKGTTFRIYLNEKN
jgi:PAS domain S-box-containing protein